MNTLELISLLNVTKGSQKKLITKLCNASQDNTKIPVLFHIDNIYVDSIFKLNTINASTIETIKKEFVEWVTSLENQIKDRRMTICSLPISIVVYNKFAYFSYEGKTTFKDLKSKEESFNRFEAILLYYLQENAAIIFNKWFIIAFDDGKIVIHNTPHGIYRLSELVITKERKDVSTSHINLEAEKILEEAPKGKFATKIFSFVRKNDKDKKSSSNKASKE